MNSRRSRRWAAVPAAALILLGSVAVPSAAATTPTAAAATAPTFTDVGPTHPFRTEISWMADQQITTGYADGRFHPVAAVGRDAMAAFLYRYNGVTWTPPAGRQSFRDVPPSYPFYKEIEWAATQSQLLIGYPNGTFRPAFPMSRQVAADALYEMAGSPPVSLGSKTLPFHDTFEETVGIEAITWMANMCITTGNFDGNFGLSDHLTRQAFSAFLFRYHRVVVDGYNCAQG